MDNKAITNSTYLEYSDKINATLQKFHEPNGNFDQVFFGIPIPVPIETFTNISSVINVGQSFVVGDELHNNKTSILCETCYADVLVVYSVNNYIEGDISGAFQFFKKALAMWNGSGLVDTPVQNGPCSRITRWPN